MSILIKGLEMPEGNEMLCINIYPDGRVCIDMDLHCKPIAQAVELPPHGRLIDEDDVREQIDEWLDSVGYPTIGKGLSYYGELLGCVEDAPTIIEAEEDEV